MECSNTKIIAIARLRSQVKYVEPLEHILDSFYFLLKEFMNNNSQYNYTFYNISFDGSRPKRDIEAIKKADIIIIPTENEFHYHITNYIHPKNLEKSNIAIENIKPFLQDKKIILLRSDRADSIELYRNFTFKDVNCEIDVIDEIDFRGNVHILKHHFIKEHRLVNCKYTRIKDYKFGYWGTDKRKISGKVDSGDNRHKILRAIDKNDNISTVFIGRFANIKRDFKMLPMRNVIWFINKSHTTLCFNWLDSKATTSRYHEAMACGCVPLVWDNYDSTNILVATDKQRCYSIDDVISKIDLFSSDSIEKKELLDTINHKYYSQTIRSKESFIDEFNLLLNNKV
jgi:hypothetical protein